MLKKELSSALVMSALVVFFAVQLKDMADEARLFPQLLLIGMGIFNIIQYVQAWIRHRDGIDHPLSLRGYPLKRVLILFVLTLIYLGILEYAGFYSASILFFFIGTLIAQPMPLTGRNVGIRALGCVLFVGALYLLFTVLLKVQIPQGILFSTL